MFITADTKIFFKQACMVIIEMMLILSISLFVILMMLSGFNLMLSFLIRNVYFS